MEIVEIGPAQALDPLYRDVLAPSFPPAELITLDTLRDGITRGRISVFAARTAGRQDLGAAVGEWFPASRITVLRYLAARPGARGRGVGARLLAAARHAWLRRPAPAAVVAEVEHPAAHTGSTAHGDPTARLRFYARHGARALDVPYFQAALRPGEPRVYGLLLCLVAATPGLVTDAGFPADPLARLVRQALTDTEHAVGSDPATTALLAALPPQGRVAVRSLAAPRLLGYSAPAGPVRPPR
ncbi:MAG TPA: hypothetical protein VFY17_02125 [Pilimelia sp.]|nr:hypothetical protein [Pilimelia sp.]